MNKTILTWLAISCVTMPAMALNGSAVIGTSRVHNLNGYNGETTYQRQERLAEEQRLRDFANSHDPSALFVGTNVPSKSIPIKTGMGTTNWSTNFVQVITLKTNVTMSISYPIK